MDIFKQNRYLFFTIILLVALNIGTILMLWLGRPDIPMDENIELSPEIQRVKLKEMLKEEMNFSEDQISEYLRLRKELRENARLLNQQIREVKKQMFDEVLEDNPNIEISDSLLSLAQNKQAELEKITFHHFLDLKKLCNDDQKDKLKILMGDIFRMEPPRKKGGRANRRPDGNPPPRRK